MKLKLNLMLLLAALFFPTIALADDYACRLVLCLANPGGPRQYAECRPTMNRFDEDMAKGRPIPTCTEASGTTNIKQVRKFFEDCEAGYSPVEAEFGFIAKGALTDNPNRTSVQIGYGRNKQYANIQEQHKLIGNTRRACVKQDAYLATYSYQPEKDGQIFSVPIYSDLIMQTRVVKPRFFEVYIDGKLFHSVNY